MKANIKICNPNANGQNSIETYNNIKELKNILLKASYILAIVLIFVALVAIPNLIDNLIK